MDPGGTEIPDHVDMTNSKGELVSMEVVLETDRKKIDPETQIALPKGTKLFEDEKAVKAAKQKPMALSQMPKQADPVRPHATPPKSGAFALKDKPETDDE